MSTARADKQLTALQKILGLSDAGKAFLTAAIDPFHDEEIPNLRGIPDGINSRSCVQTVRATKQFSCPSTVTTGTWDCHVVSSPFVSNTSLDLATFLFTPADEFTGLISNRNIDGTLQGSMAPITTYSGATPLTCYPTLNSTNTRGVIDIPVNLQGDFRVIAKGFEVISSGPDLYKSGTVFVWNQPVANDNKTPASVIFNNNGGVELHSVSEFLCYDMFPTTASAANEIPNSASWPAKEGVYVVDRMQSAINPTNWYTSKPVLLIDENFVTAGSTQPTYLQCGGAVSKCVSTKWGDDNSNSHMFFDTAPNTNFGFSGAFFTGLNLQDTLTVNVIWYIERVPTIGQLDLLLLAQPTPCIDRVALDMYSYLAGVMPVGMFQRSNGFGDWFKDAVSVVTDVIAPVASVLPGPIGAIGKGALAVGGLTKKLLSDSRAETAPAPFNEREQSIVIDPGRNENLVIRPSKGNKKVKSKIRKEDGKALMDLNSLKQELKSMRTKMKKKKKK